MRLRRGVWKGAEGIIQDWARGAGSLSMRLLHLAARPVAVAAARLPELPGPRAAAPVDGADT